MPDSVAEQAFADLVDPFRHELTVHCYRMLGSPLDAEDMVQETYLRAWRGFAGFEGRSSVRTWLYRIATNVCLNALESRRSRILPSAEVPPSDDSTFGLAPLTEESRWVQPMPDHLVEPSPEAVVLEQSVTRLAMVAALQRLSARERAAVILHDVVALTSAEVADSLGTTQAAVNSALQRARSRLTEARPQPDEITEPSDPVARRALDSYVEAFNSADIPLLVDLLRADVTIEMPPTPTWFAGRDAVFGFLTSRVKYAGSWHLLPTTANGQPAAAAYFISSDGALMAHSVHVLTVTTTGISRIVAFRADRLFEAFGFPGQLPD